MDRRRGAHGFLLATALALGGFAVLRLSRATHVVHDRPPDKVVALREEIAPPQASSTLAVAMSEPNTPEAAREPAAQAASAAYLAGVVCERSGRNLVGARCELRRGVPGGGFFERVPLEAVPALATTDTDADGRFRFFAGPGYWSVRVAHPGYSPWERDHLLAGDELQVRLDPEVRLIVTVLDPTGEPVEGAEAFVRETVANGPEDWRARLRTDPRGRAETDELAPGSWRLTVRHPGHAAIAVPLEIPVGLGRVEREIRLERGVRLVGTVRSEEQAPIAGARVRIESPYQETFLLIEATSDDSGRYVTEPVFSSSETLEVLASARGFAESTQWLGIQPAQVSAGEAVQDFVLELSGRALRGRVVDGAGAAVGGASVRVAAIDLSGLDPADPAAVLQAVPRAPWLWQEAARTAAGGTFELTNLVRSQEYAVLIVHDAFAPRMLWSPPGEPSSMHDFGDVVLVAHGGLFGRALWEDGTPAEGELLTIGRMSRVHLGPGQRLRDSRPDAWAHVLARRVGEGGRFRFDQLAPGTYLVLSSSVQAEVSSGPPTGPIEVVLQGRAPGPEHELAGFVRDRGGAPIPVTFVRAFALEQSRERFVASCLVDDRGAFSLRVPAGSAVRLVFTDLRGAHEDQELRLDPLRVAGPLEVVLEPRAVALPPLDGLVFGPRGDAVEGCSVTLHPPEDSLCACITFQKKTDATGAFRFSISEGPHRLVASDPRFAPATYAPAWPGDHVVIDMEER